MKSTSSRAAATALLVCAGLITAASAAAIRTNSGFTTSILPGNDDGSTGPVSIGFNANFFGTTYSSLFVNNNGNVTFNGPLGTFTPFNLVTTGVPIIAPFFADVDTSAGTGPVTYGNSTVNGHLAFGVNWVNVGRYVDVSTPEVNSFQLVMIDRSDLGAGDFDFEFNYGSMGWDTGQASGGASARVGWSNGSTSSFEVDGSGVNGAFVDGGANSLLTNSSPVRFTVRNGAVAPQPDTPTNSVPDSGSTVLLLGVTLLGFEGARRRLAKA